MAGKGRTTKLTKGMIEAVCHCIEQGVTQERTAEYVGVSESTFYRWIDRGKVAKSGIYKSFWENLQKAHAACEVKLVEQVQAAAKGGEITVETRINRDADGNVTSSTTIEKQASKSWQAAMTLLERRWPERWGRFRSNQPEKPEAYDVHKPLPLYMDVESLPLPPKLMAEVKRIVDLHSIDPLSITPEQADERRRLNEQCEQEWKEQLKENEAISNDAIYSN